MKIGIITHPLYTNYGGLLQAYALQTTLERLGHEAFEIEIKRKKRQLPFWKLPLSISKRILKKYVLGCKMQKILVEKYENHIWPIITQNTQQFVDKYLNQKLIENYDDLDHDFDAFIVGSDQVWRYKYYPWFGNDIANVYLKFASPQSIKIAYAASFGADLWEYPKDKTEECKRLAQKFRAISVREKSGVKLCHDFLDVNATFVLDPTMLLQKADYESLINTESLAESADRLFCYVLDRNTIKDNIIKDIAKNMKLTPYYVNANVYDSYSPIKDRIQPAVEKWLCGFRDSDYVITDSFHACVFSIIFHKQFAVIGNEERGMARFNSLLSLFGLENRLVTSSQQILSLPLIDFDAIDEKLSTLRTESLNFLIEALGSK